MSKLLITLGLLLCLALLSASVADATPLREKLASQLAHSTRRPAVPTKALNSAAPVAAVAAPMSFGSLALHQLKSMGSLSQRAASIASMRVDTAGLGTGAIVGIIVGAVVLLFILSMCCCYHEKYIVAGGGVPVQGGGTTVINTGGAAPAAAPVAAAPTSTVVV